MIRAATPADAQAIAEVEVRCWQRDYADIVPADRLAERTLETRLARWHEILAGDATIAVADVAGGGGVAGYVATGPGVLRALYVAPHAQGAGVGTALLAHGHAALAGTGEATLWVFRDNERARRFYERHGWTHEAGSEALAPPEWVAPAVRYRRAF